MFIVSRKIDILQANTNLKLLHIVLIFIIMATVTASFYKIASIVLLLITFCLVIYILTSEFLRIQISPVNTFSIQKLTVAL